MLIRRKRLGTGSIGETPVAAVAARQSETIPGMKGQAGRALGA